MDGFRFSEGEAAVLGIFAVDTSAIVFGMPSALFLAVRAAPLGGDASTVGFLYAAPAAGALVGRLLDGPRTSAGRGSV